MTARYRLDLRYRGTAFAGWQAQPGRRTVQGELARLLGFLGETARPTGAGRTDAGVHALHNVAHVDLARSWDASELGKALDSLASEDLAILSARRVDDGFHARYGAVRRTYAYAFRSAGDPFFADRAWAVRGLPEPAWVAGELASLPADGDFAALARTGGETATTRCRAVRAEWRAPEGGAMLIVGADRFLYGMVRTLAGTLVHGGRRDERPGYLRRLLESGDRRRAGAAAPAHGLYLLEVRYPGDPGRDPDPAPVGRLAGLAAAPAGDGKGEEDGTTEP